MPSTTHQSSSERRRLIYIDWPDSADISLEALRECDWNVVRIPALKVTGEQLSECGPGVGLLNLSGDESPAVRTLLESLFEHPTMTWVALLPQRFNMDSILCRLIYRFCFDYLTLPFEITRAANTLGHAYGMTQLQQHCCSPSDVTPIQDHSIIGDSPQIRLIREKINRIARVNAPILIGGESGTGKELVARAIHAHSERSQGNFEAVNCAALPQTLIQSELFGYERGAFTGAHHRKIGRFEAANGGTLFLDEIGDLPLELQVVLLRVLDQGALRRLGGVDDIHIDIRIIAATHIDLEKAVTDGRFREDLYYRLNVLNLKLPTLRERGDDIDTLVNHFLRRFANLTANGPPHLTAQASLLIHQYNWPGNIRELINRIQHAVVMCEHSQIKPGDLGLERRLIKRQCQTLEQARSQVERETIKQALKHNHGQITETARELAVSRTTLYRLLEKHQITSCPHH